MLFRILALTVLLSLSACAKKDAYPERIGMTGGAEAHFEKRAPFLAYEHSVTIDTDEAGVPTLYQSVIAACSAKGGDNCTVLDARMETGRELSAHLRLRAKPDTVRDLLSLVARGGDVTGRGTHVEDLGAPIIDSNKRLAMLKTYQASLLELEHKAHSDVASLIAISKELAGVQSELEAAAGTNAQLLQRVNMDVLDISIGTHASRASWAPVAQAFRDFSSNFAGGIANFVTAVPYILPWALLLLIAWLVWRRYRKNRVKA